MFQRRYLIGTKPDGSSAFGFWRERCVRNNGEFRWAGRIHEVLVNHSPLRVKRTDEIVVEHAPPAGREKDPLRNLRVLEAEYKASGGNPGTRTLFYFGRDYAHTGDAAKAIEILTHCGREDPWPDQRCLALVQTARLHFRQGEQERATDCCLESLKSHPAWLNADYGLGEIYCRQEWDKVIHWLDTARMRPKPATPLFINEWKQKIERLIHYTNALARVGRAGEAHEWTLKALELEPTNQWRIASLAYFDQIAGNSALAELDRDGICLGRDGSATPC